jgi:5-methylcytosine-specific restriction enzyme A
MPTRPKIPCRHPGCPEVVKPSEKYCSKHKRQASQVRGSSTKQGYGANWRKIRAMYLRENPLCEPCKDKGITKIADLVHHKDGNNKNNEWENFESNCWDCHRSHHGFGGQGA